MPAISNSIVARDAVAQLAKRENWAQQEPGVITVLVIVGVVGIGLLSLFISRKISAHRATKQNA
jgi:hypothetical protein